MQSLCVDFDFPAFSGNGTYGLGLVFLGRLGRLLRFVLGGGYLIFHHASTKLLPRGLLLWVGERQH